ncbi:MAG: AAA family ATPase [Lentisphaeraceae bacterium]|nr:AAA family ATPase [Lentisphaeraceae bacterium]
MSSADLQVQSTEDVKVPDRLIDQIVGQDRAVDIVRLAAKQRRFLFIVGEPGTGKSMLGQAVAEILDDPQLNDIVALENKSENFLPEIKTLKAGEGDSLLEKSRELRQKESISERFILWTLAAATLLLGLYFAIRDNAPVYLLSAAFVLFIIWQVLKKGFGKKDKQVPKVLVSNKAKSQAPFIDATGSQAGALLGDVRHDPYQSGGSETPPHALLEAGAIHRAHGGVLFIDEVSTLSMESQQNLLTAIQQKEMPILGRSQGSSGTMVRSKPVPCDFLLILAGNVEDIENMHPALRSRIRGYGYEIFTHDEMPDTADNRQKLVQFIAQEIKRDGKIPHFDRSAIDMLIAEAAAKASKSAYLTTKLRELGGLIRIAGDLAVNEGAKLVSAYHVQKAQSYSSSLEEQQKHIQKNQEVKTHD